MEKCWTCETEVSGNHFTCNVCEKTRTKLFESPRISKSTTMSKFIDYSITELFFGKEYTQLYISADISSNLENINANLENIASIIEWGFEELSWRMEQMTTVLQSIDNSLKTPEETKANEQRLMAEELRKRALLTDSEKFFLKSLEINPLDYRTYIGLAQTHLQQNAFDQAKAILVESVTHALTNVQKSYTYRLIGRTLFAEGEYEQAVKSLELSIKISPDYALGHYDYAKYCALIGRKEDCINSLEIAVINEPSIFKLAEKEANFRIVGGVQAVIERLGIHSKILNLVPPEVAREYFQIIKDLGAVEAALAASTPEYRKKYSSDIKACLKECERARDEIKKAWQAFEERYPKVQMRFKNLAMRGTLTRALGKTIKAKNMLYEIEHRDEVIERFREHMRNRRRG